MSNPRPALSALLACCCSTGAFAQSNALLESIRLHRPGASEAAKTELQECLDAKCPDADRLSLLLGFLELSESDAAEATKQLASRPPPKGLEAFHAWYLGEAQAWAGRTDDALKSFKKAKGAAPEWLKSRIDARSAELWLEVNKPAKALPLLEAAALGDVSPELLYRRGAARWQTGEVEKGKADLRAVLVRFPAHPFAALAEQHLAPVTYTFDERLARANGFLAAQDPTKAQVELDAAVAPQGREARFALAKANVLIAKGDEKAAFEQIDVAMGGSPGVAAEALMLRARRLMRANENRVAREVLLKLDQTYGNQGAAEEAGYLASWIGMQAGDFAQAAGDFERFEANHPGSRKRDEARWFGSYSLYRAGQYAKAQERLQSLLTDFPRSSLVPQARYWLVRCAQKLDGTPDAGGAKVDVKEAFKSIIATFPGSFYALLSSERLREMNEVPPPPFANPPKSLTIAPPSQLKLAILLAKAGLFRDAGEEVSRETLSVGSGDSAMKFGHALQGIGEFGPAYSLAARLLWGAAYTLKQPEAIALLYPRAYSESVEKFSHDRGLDPYLAWAIMRQESAFRPEVASFADARGLMQLIPPTARAIAKEIKIEAPSPDELYAPEANISLGTWYLSALLERFGHPSLCAAAYNAGAAPVIKWASTRGELPLDEWVEEIPWKETRGYVKNVTANYFVYRTLYGKKDDEPMRLSLKVPLPKEGGVNF
jgi:soluble lytic murein transglycosylase